MALTPDGSRLFVALLTRAHGSAPNPDGYVASFDLATQVKDRESHIADDPYDLIATSNARLVVSSGSGSTGSVRVLDAATGQQLGVVGNVDVRLRLTLHPSEGKLYAANTNSNPSDIRRFDLLAGGGISNKWDSPYHGEHRMDGNVWASPRGDALVTRGGDVFTAGSAQSEDMIYLAGLSEGTISDLTWDAAHSTIFTVEGSMVRYYDLTSRLEMGRHALSGTGSFVGVNGGQIYAGVPSLASTRIESFAQAALGGSTNTAPISRFRITPQGDGTDVARHFAPAARGLESCRTGVGNFRRRSLHNQ